MFRNKSFKRWIGLFLAMTMTASLCGNLVLAEDGADKSLAGPNLGTAAQKIRENGAPAGSEEKKAGENGAPAGPEEKETGETGTSHEKSSDEEENETGSGESETEPSDEEENETGSGESETEPSDGEENETGSGESETEPSDEEENETGSGESETEPSDREEASEIDGWEWMGEEKPQWSQERDAWVLLLSGYSEENPLERERLKELLPGSVKASLAEGDTREAELPIQWKLDNYPEKAWEGEYTLFADPGETYLLSEEAGSLELLLILEAENLEGLENNRVYGLTPQGTTVNVFDYWLTERDSPDNTDPQNLNTVGINGNPKGGQHELVFSKNTNNRGKAWNKWTGYLKDKDGGKQPYQGIVINNLGEDGYPKINPELGNGVNPEESLAYLFDRSAHPGKQSFFDVKGLLQIDQENYYYYDCVQNYAYLDEAAREFRLYNKGGIKGGGNIKGLQGQFFPFNPPEDAFTVGEDGTLELKDRDANDSKMNHYFGMTMSTRFIQTKDGLTERGKVPVTYEFSGDDDVWIFIDDVLVADLGGIHDAVNVKIDFSTGEIVYNKVDVEDGELTLTEWRRTTLKTAFEEAGREWKGKGSTFADGSYHTLKFFYLERGNSQSNISLRFNLVTVPATDIIKVDQVGNPVRGAKFALYGADKNYDYAKENLLAEGVTDDSGSFTLKEKDGSLISLQDLEKKGFQYFVLSEEVVPEGYRALKETHLYLHSAGTETVLLSANAWETGAYASAKVTTNVDSQVTDTKGEPHNLSQGGTMFAVVLKYIGGRPENQDDLKAELEKDENWKVVWGEPIKGWKTAPATKGNIIQAAKGNPYLFQIGTSGAYQGEIENLPGDVRNYYFMLPAAERNKEVEYTVAYYYSSAANLSQATPDNTVRLSSDGYTRQFSAKLYIPNVKNYLMVQKLDDEEEPLEGAKFALYEEEAVNIESGTPVLPEGAEPYLTTVTRHLTKEKDRINLEGGGIFPEENDLLELGTYYLREETAPEGYKANQQLIKVVVDNTGIYADAGTKEDGVSVARGAGSLVKSMVQFAAEDEIDRTLHDVKATLMLAYDYKGEGQETEWTGPDASNDETRITHLSYQANTADLEYGAKDGYKNLLSTDEGWSVLRMEQCLEHGKEYKQELPPGTVLTQLFSRTAVVQVRNQRMGALKIEKKVKGESPKDQKFSFTLKLEQQEGDKKIPLTGSFPGTLHKDNASTEGVYTLDKDGQLIFTLGNGDFLQLKELPADILYTVTEEAAEGYETSFNVNDGDNVQGVKASGTVSPIAEKQDGDYVLFINQYSGYAALELSGQKTLEGRPMKEEESFQFLLKPADEITKAAVEAGTILAGTQENPVEWQGEGPAISWEVQGDGKTNPIAFRFPRLTFKKEGTYSFTISEVEGNLGNIQYDLHGCQVTVTVKANDTGLLKAKAAYSNEGAPSQEDAAKRDMAAFTNALTGDLSFQKTDKDGNALDGAKFALYRLICSNEKHNHSKELVKFEEDGKVAESQKECWELTSTAASGQVSSVSGTVSFSGLLASSEYRLAELKAPDGYVRASGQWHIIYNEEMEAFVFPENSAVGNPPAVENTENIYKIKNYKPGEMPLSGGRGTFVFLAAGAALMLAGAGGTLWYKKRRKMVR